VPSVCNIHMMTLLVMQIFIELLELKLQYYYMLCVVVLCRAKVSHSSLCYWISKVTFNSTKVRRWITRLWGDTKLQLKQPNLG